MRMSHAVDRCREGRATERRAQLDGAGGWHAGSRRVAVAPVWPVATPGLPIPSGSAGDWPCGAVGRAVGADHAEDAGEHRARCAGVFGDQRLDTQRDRNARDHGLSRGRTWAWLTDRRWLMRRSGRRGVGFRQIPDEYLYQTLGLYVVPRRRVDLP